MYNEEELKEQIEMNNTLYRAGDALISDEAYDALLNDLKSRITEKDFNEFRKTLTETKGSVDSDYILGSLVKMKYEEVAEFKKWIKKYNIKELFVSEKIDGASVMAQYRNGKLISCSSRGDGNTGTDWTDKAQYFLPTKIDFKEPLDIRGELTLHHKDIKSLGYKNTRSGTIGILNSKDVTPKKLKYINAYFYEVLSYDWFPEREFYFLQAEGFNIPKIFVVTVTDGIHEVLKNIYYQNKEFSSYAIDGLVISSTNHIRENVFLPDAKVAFKVNSKGVQTMVENITWEVSKGNKLVPVCNITPIEIDGTTVSNVTGNNAKNLVQNGIGIGSIINVIKSGQIIPLITEVIETCDDINIPTICPCCNSPVVWKGVDIVCTNPDCPDATRKQVEHFIKKSDIENVSETTLKNWSINTFDDLISWKPDTFYKTQVDFYNELQNKVFKKPHHTIMRNFSINGIGQTNFDKLLNHYGSLSNLNDVFLIGDYTNLPFGIGSTTIENAKNDWFRYMNILNNIVNDVRYDISSQQDDKEVNMKLQGKSFLITGTLSRKRSIVEQEIKDNGGIIASSVTKNLDYLIAASEESGSNKYKKATQLGIKIISEDEYNEMI